MEKKKRKYSRTDRLILGIGFTILGLFVLSIAIPAGRKYYEHWI